MGSSRLEPPLFQHLYSIFAKPVRLCILIGDLKDLLSGFTLDEETDHDFMQLQDSLTVFLHPDSLHELEHTPEGEHEIRYAQMICLFDHESLHGLLVIVF